MITQLVHTFGKAALGTAFITACMFVNANAQTDAKIDDNKIHIKISKDVNGKHTEIDTTFTDENAADNFMEQWNDDHNDADISIHDEDDNDKDGSNANMRIYRFKDDSTGTGHFNFNFNGKGWSDEDRKNFEEKMSRLNEKMKAHFKSFDMKQDTASDGNDFNYNFNFDMPGMEQLKEKLKDMKFNFDFNMPPLSVPKDHYNTKGMSTDEKKKFEDQLQKAKDEYKKALEMLKDKDELNLNENFKMQCPYGYAYAYNNGNDSKLKSKSRNNRVVIITKTDGSKNENSKTKSSKKIKSFADDSASPDFKISNLKYYPNPSDGKFDASFDLPTRGDLNVSIIDGSGKKIYDETLKDFRGNYSQSFDISSEGAGIYMLNIKQGNEWMHKKIVVK